MKIYNLAQSFFIISVLTGCMAKPTLVSDAIQPVKPIFFIKHNESGARASLIGGILHLDPYGCIRLDSDTGPFIIWADSTELAYTNDGKVSITNKLNGHKFFIGDEIILGGGRTTVIPKSVTSSIPEVCTTHGYWPATPL
jgi:hypothetical protein